LAGTQDDFVVNISNIHNYFGKSDGAISKQRNGLLSITTTYQN
jgi:hypothetical protein